MEDVSYWSCPTGGNKWKCPLRLRFPWQYCLNCNNNSRPRLRRLITRQFRPRKHITEDAIKFTASGRGPCLCTNFLKWTGNWGVGGVPRDLPGSRVRSVARIMKLRGTQESRLHNYMLFRSRMPLLISSVKRLVLLEATGCSFRLNRHGAGNLERSFYNFHYNFTCYLGSVFNNTSVYII